MNKNKHVFFNKKVKTPITKKKNQHNNKNNQQNEQK